MKIFTFGHSTRSIKEFLDILKHFNIELLIDVRRWPTSKKFPWFSKDNLQEELVKENIRYIHYPELGGYRKEGYATFAKTEEFTEALKKLLEMIDNKIAVILCAEKLWFRCHRKYIAERLAEQGNEIIHILDEKTTYEHKLKTKDLKQKMNLRIWCDKKARKIILP